MQIYLVPVDRVVVAKSRMETLHKYCDRVVHYAETTIPVSSENMICSENSSSEIY